MANQITAMQFLNTYRDSLYCCHYYISLTTFTLNFQYTAIKPQSFCCSVLTLAPYSEILQCFVQVQPLHVKDVNWCFLMSLNCFTFLHRGDCLFHHSHNQNEFNVLELSTYFLPSINMWFITQSSVNYDFREGTFW